MKAKCQIFQCQNLMSEDDEDVSMTKAKCQILQCQNLTSEDAEDRPPFDLEERTFQFALEVRECIDRNRWRRSQWPDISQLLRSSGSVASNYTEANNAFSKADFRHRIGIAKKEAGESRLWLRLLGSTTHDDPAVRDLRHLFKESDELTRIFAKIHRSSSGTD